MRFVRRFIAVITYNPTDLCLFISRNPQILATMCRNMGNCDVFMAVAARENISGFYLIRILLSVKGVDRHTSENQNTS